MIVLPHVLAELQARRMKTVVFVAARRRRRPAHPGRAEPEAAPRRSGLRGITPRPDSQKGVIPGRSGVMNRKKISFLSALASGALAAGASLIGSPASAGTTEPATTAEARQMAQESQARAEQYRAMGGVGYKTGLVQREEARAARYSALADQMEAASPRVTAVVVAPPDSDMTDVAVVVTPPPAPPETSPAAEEAAAKAARYRSMGGAGYKTGMVQSAEAEQRRAEAAVEPQAPGPEPNPICLTSKPAVIPACG
jgi:hypothetical protein